MGHSAGSSWSDFPWRLFSVLFRRQIGRQLLVAVRQGFAGAVIDCISRGASLEETDDWIVRFGKDENRIGGMRPLMHAARKGRTDLVRVLLEAGADIHARNGWSQTALMLAVANAKRDAVLLLIRSGAAVDDCDYSGRTVLMQSLHTNDPRLVQAIIDAGANVNEYTLNIGTALNLAWTLGKKDMIELLEKAGGTMIDWDELYAAPP